MATTKNMTVGTPWKLITGFAVPIFLSQLFQQLYNTVDSLVVGNYLGTNALAAVSSSGTLIFLMVSFFAGLSMGAGVVISRYFGGNELDKMSRALHTDVAMGLICGMLMTLLGVTLTPVILRWMATDPEVMPEAVEYFRYYFLGGLSMAMYNICTGIMNALGDSRRPLYYLIFSSLLNIVLDLLFIGAFGWGVWSAALATTVSQTASVALCLRHLCKKGTIYQLFPRKIRLHKDMLGEILRCGLPAGIQNSVIALANVIVQSNINAFGKNATAGYGSYAKIEGFGFLPINSFSMALTTFVSQNLGARAYDRARRGSRFGILAGISLAELIGLTISLFAPTLIGMFTRDADVIHFGVQQARTVAPFYFLLAYSHCVAAICRGAGKAFVPMLVMLAIWCALRIVYITVVMQITHDIQYIYWAYPMTWAISSAIYFVYYHRSDWIHGFDGADVAPRHS